VELTFAQVEAEVRRLVAEDPEHIYQGKPRNDGRAQMCYYVAPEDGSAEACLFGQALSNLGVSDDVLAGHEQSPVSIVLSSLDVAYTYRQERWLSSVQNEQDHKRDWAGAVAYGDAEYPLHDEAASV
jgi:hypothetical protein